MALRYLYYASLLLSVIVGFIYRKDLRNRQLFYFVPFLFLVFVQEISIFFYLLKYPNATTGIIYNIYQPICTLFLSAFYYFIPFNKPLRKIIFWLFTVYLIVTLFTFCYIQPVQIFNSYLFLAGGLVITCCGIFFLFNYFNLDNRTQEKHWRPVIWITIGIIVFYPIVNISFAFYKHLLAYQAKVFGIPLYNLIPKLMSIFMYSCFTYAFYLCKKKN